VQDVEVVVDVAWLVLESVRAGFETEHPKLAGFVREFVPLFFGLDTEVFAAALKEKYGGTPPNESVEEGMMSGGEEAVGGTRGRKAGKNGNGNLLRTALDRGRLAGKGVARKEREESAAAASNLSRATTPDVASNAGDPEDMALDGPDAEAEGKQPQGEKPLSRWFEHPATGNNVGGGSKDVDPAEPQRRDVYKLWANTSLYCFVRMLLTVHDRLLKIKNAEASVADAVRRAEAPKPALDLGIVDKVPRDFFQDPEGTTTTYYTQMLGKLRDVVRGEMEMAEVEEALRRFYLKEGYPLYAFEKMMTATARFALMSMNGEGKEKSWEVYLLFRKDRTREATTAGQQTEYRKAVEKIVKDGDLYRIDYDQAQQAVAMFLAKKDDPAYYGDGTSPLDLENAWRRYVASYQTVDDTDGVPREALNVPLLLRNARAMGTDPKSTSYPPSPPLMPADRQLDGGPGPAAMERITNRVLAAKGEENLTFRIETTKFFAKFEPESQEGWTQPLAEREAGEEGVEAAEQARVEREEVVRERFTMNHVGMRGMSREEVDRRNEVFKGIERGDVVEREEVKEDVAEEEGEGGDEMEVDG